MMLSFRSSILRCFPAGFGQGGINVRVLPCGSRGRIAASPALARFFSRSPEAKLFESRGELRYAKRVVVKLGSTVITRADECGLALGRLGNIVEELSELKQAGHDVILVTSGAVAFGKQRLRYEALMSQTVRKTLSARELPPLEPRACAAAGQSGLMSLYQAMFDQYGVTCAQVLLTKPDFQDPECRVSMQGTLDELLKMGIVPICNENDVMSKKLPEGTQVQEITVTDNDALAALLAVEVGADLLIIMSDVSGVYNAPPDQPGSKILHTFRPGMDKVTFGGKSKAGRGGMESKIKSAEWALRHGCNVVICNGQKHGALSQIMAGKEVGTFFTFTDHVPLSMEDIARAVRESGRLLASAAPSKRAQAIHDLAEMLLDRKAEIVAVNQEDILNAKEKRVADALISRLKLTDSKLSALADGLKQIADSSHGILGRVLRRTELAPNLLLEQETVPLGVILMIFEARPDALPQVAALSIASGNGIILKGGKEAERTNALLHSMVTTALKKNGFNEESCVLVKDRAQIKDLLSMTDYIDLVVPRGSNKMVKEIQSQTSIPVLGHAEGICHVFVDETADVDKIWSVVKDSKCDYPAACNAMETLLIHEKHRENGIAKELVMMLASMGVKVRVGPRLARDIPDMPLVESFKTEYSALECGAELVTNVQEAIDHINRYGSSHTDAIVTENKENAAKFMNAVDSACVFHNASTRFADGYRFGLGAELGISTERVHARGPVGVEGLLTTRWRLVGNGDNVADFNRGTKSFTHKSLPIDR